MIRLAASLALLLVFTTARVFGTGADDLFITVYNQIQQADAQVDAGRTSDAFAGYAKAQEDLQKLRQLYPTWNERVVNYRLRYVSDKLEALKGSARPASDAASEPGKPPTGKVDVIAPSGEVISQFNTLKDQIQRLAAEKGLLEARLREALSAQPAPVDPRKLQEAVEKITALQETNKSLVAKLDEQEAERKNLVDKVVAEEAQRALNEANRQLLEQRLALGKAEKSKAEIEARLKSMQDGPVKKLEGENAALKRQVSELKSDTEKGRQVAELAGKLSRLQTQVDDLKKQNDTLTSEKAALEKHLSDINVRKAEESIVRVAKLETDLALAQADAARNTQKAEALAVALSQARVVNNQLEDQNKSLEERVTSLTKENTTVSAAVKRLQDSLAEEQSSRAQLELKLKTAEQQLAALATPKAPTVATGPAAISPAAAIVRAPAPDPETFERMNLIEAEAKNLRAALRESRERETEVRNALADEQAMRARLQKERFDLERKLAALVAASTNQTSMAMASISSSTNALPRPAAQVTAALEKRVRELERQREDLQRRLASLGVRLDGRVSTVRPMAPTPREHAADLRSRR